MKQLITLFFAGTILTGCGMYTVDEEANNAEEAEETEQVEEVETSGQEENAEIEFVLQESDRQAQVSPLNDESLRILSDRVNNEEAETVGEEDEITLDYSGAYLNTADSIYGVFLLTNRTDTPMTDLSMDITMGAGNDRILDHRTTYLTEEHFGVLEPDTAMPVYIHFDTEQEEQLSQYSDPNSVDVEVDNLDFVQPNDEETTEENRTDQFEIENLGYNPSYTSSVVSQQELMDDIAAGDVPELELLTPPIFQNPGGTDSLSHLDEEVLNIARGFTLEDEISLYWTGVTEQTPDTGEIQTIFLIGNRTGNNYVDMTADISLSDEDGNMILDSETTQLSEEEYGVLSDGSLLPVYVTIPSENHEGFREFLESLDEEQPVYELTNFEGEEKE